MDTLSIDLVVGIVGGMIMLLISALIATIVSRFNKIDERLVKVEDKQTELSVESAKIVTSLESLHEDHRLLHRDLNGGSK